MMDSMVSFMVGLMAALTTADSIHQRPVAR